MRRLNDPPFLRVPSDLATIRLLSPKYQQSQQIHRRRKINPLALCRYSSRTARKPQIVWCNKAFLPLRKRESTAISCRLNAFLLYVMIDQIVQPFLGYFAGKTI